jgi:hypothetical protein
VNQGSKRSLEQWKQNKRLGQMLGDKLSLNQPTELLRDVRKSYQAMNQLYRLMDVAASTRLSQVRT